MRLPSWALPHAPNWRSSCTALIDQRVKYRAAWYWTHPALNINPRAMVLRCARDDRSSRELITFPPEGRPRPSDTPASEDTRKERTMLSAAYGILAMVPVVSSFAGFAMVSR